MRDIIINTDIGTDVDDAFAIYIATQQPNINIRGVYTTSGPVSLRSKIARRLLDSVSYDTIVGTGLRGPDIGEFGAPPMMTGGENWILSEEEKKMPEEYWRITEEGIKSLEEQIMKGPVEILSIAQLSNLSEVFKKNPSTIKNVQHLYILGGNRLGAEYNLLHDIQAANHVLSLDIPITVLPVDICQKHHTSMPEIVQLTGSDARRFLGLMTAAWSTSRELLDVRINVLHQLKEYHDLSINSGLISLRTKNPEMDAYEIYELLEKLTNFRDVGNEGKPDSMSYHTWKWAWSRDDSQLGKIITSSLKECEVPNTILHDAMMFYAMIHPEAFKHEIIGMDVKNTSSIELNQNGNIRFISDMDVKGFDDFLWSHIRGKELRGGTWYEPIDTID